MACYFKGSLVSSLCSPKLSWLGYLSPELNITPSFNKLTPQAAIKEIEIISQYLRCSKMQREVSNFSLLSCFVVSFAKTAAAAVYMCYLQRRQIIKRFLLHNKILEINQKCSSQRNH